MVIDNATTVRNLSRWFIAIWSSVASVMFSGHAYGLDIWFVPLDPIWRAVRGLPPNDYMEFFPSSAPWTDVARNVTVFNISKRFALQASDRDLRAVIVGLQERHIKLSMQATPLEASPICGRGVEGYETPGDMGRVAHRLLRLGATLDYLSMDEPLFYGHYFKGRGTITSCQDSIAELARAALQSVLRPGAG